MEGPRSRRGYDFDPFLAFSFASASLNCFKAVKASDPNPWLFSLPPLPKGRVVSTSSY